MAFGEKKGGDMVLESRHVIGVFLLMVVISGIVFTLGYVLGRSQYDSLAHSGAKPAAQTPADVPAPKSTGPSADAQPAGPAATPKPSEWDLYRAAEQKKSPGVPTTGKATPVTSENKASARPAAAKSGLLLNAPLIPRGAILLQVAAVKKESDALALAEALQQKKFPAFVLTPNADHYYRVQVGPYADTQSANMAKRALENEGFKSIVKR